MEGRLTLPIHDIDVGQKQSEQEVLELAQNREKRWREQVLQADDKPDPCHQEQASEQFILNSEQETEERHQQVELHFNFKGPSRPVYFAAVAIDKVMLIKQAGEQMREKAGSGLFLHQKQKKITQQHVDDVRRLDAGQTTQKIMAQLDF